MAQGIPGVMKGRHGHHPALQAHPHLQELSLQSPLGCRPEYHRHDGVGRSRRDEQHPGVHIRIEYAPCHGDAAGEESQSQHAPSHSAGEGEKQQCQPCQLLLPTKGRHCQQHS